MESTFKCVGPITQNTGCFEGPLPRGLEGLLPGRGLEAEASTLTALGHTSYLAKKAVSGRNPGPWPWPPDAEGGEENEWHPTPLALTSPPTQLPHSIQMAENIF